MSPARHRRRDRDAARERRRAIAIVDSNDDKTNAAADEVKKIGRPARYAPANGVRFVLIVNIDK